MLIFCKSPQKVSITSAFAIIVFCKTFYFIDQVFFFIRHIFWGSIFFQMNIRLNSGFRYYRNILLSDSPEVVTHRVSGGELYETHFLGVSNNIKDYYLFEHLSRAFSEYSINKVIAFKNYIFSISDFSSSETKYTEAAVYCCFSKKKFWKMFQYLQENTFVGVSL